MNVLSDILCNTSPLILSTSYNGPLLSHNASVAKPISKHNNLIDPLSSVSDVTTSTNSDRIENSIFHAPESGHVGNGMMPSNYPINPETETAADFTSNSYHEGVPSWFTNDLIKASENMPSDILPPVAEIYSTGQHNENLNMLEMGFPPEITSRSSVNCNIGTSCMSSSQNLMSVADAHGFPCSDSLLMSSFTDLNGAQMSVEKPSRSCEKYVTNNIVTQSANTAQTMISDIIPLNDHCDLNAPNQLLSLTNHIQEQALNTAINPSALQNGQGQTHHMDMMTDKLPHITLNQLDSILRINNSLDDMQIMANGFPNVSVPEKHPCNNYSSEPRIEACSENLGMMSCNDNSLSNLNITTFTPQQEEIDISRGLPRTSLNSGVNNLCLESSVDSAIEETCCFKCKYCNFISLEKLNVRNHIQGVHLKRDLQSSVMTSSSPSFYSNNMITNSNSLLTNGLNSSVNGLVNVNTVNVQYSSEGSSHQAVENQINCTQFNGSNSTGNIDASVSVSRNQKLNYVHLEPTKRKSAEKPPSKNVKKAQNLNSSNNNNAMSVHSLRSKEANSNNRAIVETSFCDQNNLPMRDGLCDPGNNSEAMKKNNCLKKTNVNDSKLAVPQRRISSHMKAWQKKIKRELGSYICEFKGCNVRFRALDNLEYHRKCHIATSGKFACPECGSNFDQWGSTAGHLWRHHSTDMELHACDNCSFRTYSLSTLENLHKPIHQNKCQFLCDTCGKGFKNGKQLRNHRVMHDKRPNNPVVKKFACSVCGRRFSKNKFLRLHLAAVHNKQRSYLCNYCQYSSSKASTLKMHMRQHTGEKPFACDVCSYQTLDHNSLRRHKMTHSGEKPYKCPYCTYACIQSSTYKVHLRKQHPEQNDQRLVFSCTVCSYQTIKEDNYRTHMASHEVRADKGPVLLEAQQQTQSEVLPLVEAVDISLSHGDHNTFLEASKGKDLHIYGNAFMQS